MEEYRRMKIENGSLVVTVQGVEKTVPLPTVTSDAKVRAVRAAKRLEVNDAYSAAASLAKY
jgi:hypothetical protein